MIDANALVTKRVQLALGELMLEKLQSLTEIDVLKEQNTLLAKKVEELQKKDSVLEDSDD